MASVRRVAATLHAAPSAASPSHEIAVNLVCHSVTHIDPGFDGRNFLVTNLDGNMFVSGKIMDVRGDSFRSDRSFAPLFRGASPDSFVAHVTLDSVTFPSDKN